MSALLSFNTVICSILVVISIGIIAAACAAFYRWRSSAFDTTDAFLRNVQRIPEDEPAVIQPTGQPNVEVHWGRRHRSALYFEYVYTVDGRENSEYWFGEDDEDSEPLPCTVKMHYHRKRPSRAYREGAVRDGVAAAWVGLFFGLVLLALSLLCLPGC